MAGFARTPSSVARPPCSLRETYTMSRAHGIQAAERLKNPGSTFILQTLKDLPAHGRMRLAYRFPEQTHGSHDLHD
jgi:hypothetical protein